MSKLQSGNKAPDFSLKDQNGKTVSLSDFKGEKLLIYFYPRAMTPGCTKQSCEVSSALPNFKKLSLKVVGISPDSPERQKRFDEKYGLGFPLLADENKKTAEAYGVIRENIIERVMGLLRSSFLVDEDGMIIKAWYKISPGDTVPEAMKELKK